MLIGLRTFYRVLYMLMSFFCAIMYAILFHLLKTVGKKYLCRVNKSGDNRESSPTRE